MDVCDILLTEAGGPVGCRVFRSLSRLGLRVAVCDSTDSGRRALPPAPVRRRTCPPACERNYVRELRKIVAETGVRALLPVFYPDLIARNRAAFPGLLIPLDDAEKLALLDDKVRCSAWADSLGVLQPQRYRLPEEDLPGVPSVEQAHFPLVFKRASGHGGDSVYFPKSMAPLLHLAGNSAPGSYLITEEIAGEDVSVDALRWGDRFYAGAYRVLLPKAKGVSVLRESMVAPALVSVVRKMLDSIDFQGVCGMDFRLGADGRFYFLECNPRFSGGLASQVASGFDVPALLWKAACGEVLPADIAFKAGRRTLSLGGAWDYVKRRHKQGKLSAGDITALLFSFPRLVDEW